MMLVVRGMPIGLPRVRRDTSAQWHTFKQNLAVTRASRDTYTYGKASTPKAASFPARAEIRQRSPKWPVVLREFPRASRDMPCPVHSSPKGYEAPPLTQGYFVGALSLSAILHASPHPQGYAS